MNADIECLKNLPTRFALEDLDLNEYHTAFFISISNLKLINGILGRDVGDRVLHELVERINNYASSGIFLCRIDGTSFLLLSKQEKTHSQIESKAKAIRKCLTRPITHEGIPVRIRTVIGIVSPQGLDVYTLIKEGDLTINAISKNKQSNSILFWSDKAIKSERDAYKIWFYLAKNRKFYPDFYLVYQPILDMSKKVISYEALLRWESPDLGFVSPDRFIPIAEEFEEISYITYWVLDRALEAYEAYQVNSELAINLTPYDLSQNNFVSTLLRKCDYYKVPMEKISFEITERTCGNLENLDMVLQSLDSHKISLKLDDFGTGDSSLKRFVDYKWKAIKIDKALIPTSNKHTQDRKIKICKAIVQLTQWCDDVQVIAEGIETEWQFDFVKSIGVSAVQGYYFSKPKRPELLWTPQTPQNTI